MFTIGNMLADLSKLILSSCLRIFFYLYFLIFGKPKIGSKLEHALGLYESKEFSGLFSLIRAWDAPFEEIEKLVPKSGIIIDLGSGDGLLANYLGIASPKRRVIGIEINKKRYQESDRGVKNVKFIHGSILTEKLPKVDSVLVVHVFHHLPSLKDQEKLLLKINHVLKRSGKLIIVEIVEKPRLKYYFTWLTDAIIVPILFESKVFTKEFYYREKSNWINLLEKLGYQVIATNADEGKPFSHIILECTRK